MRYNLISYAIDFISFYIQKTKQLDKINSIILFGSVVRGEAEKASDIDIFIDIIKEDKKIDAEAKEILQDFFDSAKYKNYWSLIGIENKISLAIGEIDKWTELKPSIIADGIILYGKYKPEIIGGRHKTFFVWENVKPDTKRVLLNKQMFGFKQKEKFYQGLLQKYNSQRLGKGCILVPGENSNIFLKFFRKYNVSVKIKKILEYD